MPIDDDNDLRSDTNPEISRHCKFSLTNTVSSNTSTNNTYEYIYDEIVRTEPVSDCTFTFLTN
jgi:hypothetical protein